MFIKSRYDSISFYILKILEYVFDYCKMASTKYTTTYFAVELNSGS